MGDFMSAGFLIGILAMLFYTPSKYYLGIIKMLYGEILPSDKRKALIPIYNIIKAESLYTEHLSKVGLATLCFVVLTALRVAVVFLCPAVYWVQLTTVILFLVSLVGLYVANVYATLVVLHDTNAPGWLWRSLLFPLGQFYIGSHLNTVIKNTIKEEKTF